MALAENEVVTRPRGADRTRRLGQALGSVARPLPPNGLVVGLHGPLGAGKTVFVQGIARGLGVAPTAAVVSPTFTVARDYPAPGRPPLVLHHLDAYRLGGVSDLEAAGFEEMVGPGRVTCVEWAERVEDAMPADRLEVDLEPGADEETREVRLRATGPGSAAVLRRFRESLEGAA